MNTLPLSALQSRRALLAMVSKTGCTSVGELEMTLRISLVAVCCSRVSVRSRLRASSSLKSRTFSMAITAWSAKVLRSSICPSVNGPASVRAIAIAPMGAAVTKHRHGQDAARSYREPLPRPGTYSGSSEDIRDLCDRARDDRTHRPAVVPGRGGRRNARRRTSTPLGLIAVMGDEVHELAIEPVHRPHPAPQSRHRAWRDGVEDGLDVGRRAARSPAGSRSSRSAAPGSR